NRRRLKGASTFTRDDRPVECPIVSPAFYAPLDNEGRHASLEEHRAREREATRRYRECSRLFTKVIANQSTISDTVLSVRSSKFFLAIALLMLPAVGFGDCRAKGVFPRFEQFPAGDLYRGKVHALALDTRLARKFRTTI